MAITKYTHVGEPEFDKADKVEKFTVTLIGTAFPPSVLLDGKIDAKRITMSYIDSNSLLITIGNPKDSEMIIIVDDANKKAAIA